MKFKVGDKVEFELSIQGQKNRPRWERGFDKGGSGFWAVGTVTEVDMYKIVVSYTIKDHVGTGICEWPYNLSPDYHGSQWSRPGFLRLLKSPTCDCGGDKANTTHSDWCSKYKSLSGDKIK